MADITLKTNVLFFEGLLTPQNKAFLFEKKKKKTTTTMRINCKQPHITKSILYQNTNIKTKFNYLSISLNPSFLKELSILTRIL